MAISRSYAGGGDGIRRRTTQPRSMFDQFFLEADQGLLGGKPMSAPPASDSAPMGAPPAGTEEPLVGFPAGVTGPFGPNSNPTMGVEPNRSFTTDSLVSLSGPPSVPGSPAFRYGDRSFATSDVASGPDTGVGQTNFTTETTLPPPPPPLNASDVLASSGRLVRDMMGNTASVGDGDTGTSLTNVVVPTAGGGALDSFFGQVDAGEELMAAIRRDPMAFRGAGVGNWRSQSGLSAMDLPQEIQNQVNTYLGSDDYRNLLGSDPRYQAEQRARELEAENASLRASISANPAQAAPTMTNVAATQGERVDSAPTTTAVTPVETLSSAGAPSDAAARATGGASDRELREQQMQMTQAAIKAGESAGASAIQGLRDYNITNAGLQFNLPAATSQQAQLDRFTPQINTQNIGLDPVNFQATADQQSLSAVNPAVSAQAQNLSAFNPTMSTDNIALANYNSGVASQDASLNAFDPNVTSQDASLAALNPNVASQDQSLAAINPNAAAYSIGLNQIDSNVSAQQAALDAMNERIALGEFAPTAGASEFETSFGNLLLGRIGDANALGGAANPQTASLLADLESTASRQRERDIAQLNRLGVLQSGNTVDVFEEGNQNLRRDRLSALAQGYANAQNDPALQAAMDLARLQSGRGITGDDQRLRARDQDIAAGQVNLDTALAARNQDLSAALANQDADLSAQQFNQQQALAARGQDLTAEQSNQLANLDTQRLNLETMLSGRQQDADVALANQRANLEAQGMNLDAMIAGRAQDADIALANQRANLEAQGMDLDATLAGRAQDADIALANQRANLEAQQFNETQNLAARAQDLTEGELNQLANLRAQESQADARLRGREQDRLTALANQQADLDAQLANLDATMLGRQQDSDIAMANQAAGLDAQRLNLEALLTGRDQDLTAGQSNQRAQLEGQIAAMDAGLTARDQDMQTALANQAADLDAQRLNADQQFGIADRQLTDASRRSADEQFAANLGLRQLAAQQDIADRVTSRQLLQGDVTGREAFEESVRQARVGESQFADELQNRLDQISAQGTADQDLQNILGRQSLSQLAAQGTNQRLLQELVNSGALNQLSQQGSDAQDLQRIVNQGNLSALARQGFDAQELQKLVNQGSIAGLEQQGMNAQELQRMLGQQAISQMSTEGTNQRLLQTLINQGDIAGLQQQGLNAESLQELINTGSLNELTQQGTNASDLQRLVNQGNLATQARAGFDSQELQKLVNQGAMDQTTANNLLQQNLATGQFGDQDTLERILTNQQVNFANQLMPSQLEAANIANRDASSMIDERRFGQLVSLLSATQGNNFLQGALPDDLNANITNAFDALFSGQDANTSTDTNLPEDTPLSRAAAQARGLERFLQQNENFSASNVRAQGNTLYSLGNGQPIAEWNRDTDTWERKS